MNTCQACQRIPFGQLPYEDEEAIPHYPTLAALELSAKTCSFCNLILLAAGEYALIRKNEQTGNTDANPGGWITHVAEKSSAGKDVMIRIQGGNRIQGMMTGTKYAGPMYMNPREQYPDGSNVRAWLFGNWWKIPGDNSSRQLIGLGVRLGTGPRDVDADGNSEESITYRGSNLRIRTDNSSALAAVIPGRLRTADSKSIIGYKRLENWLNMCDKQHRCFQKESTLPTRVIDVNLGRNPGSVRLIDSNGQSGRYITLSHCWGESHRVTTTKATFQSHKSGIPLASLPATFRDAVEIARYLKIPFLWIDSLCIVQDDVRDWEVEASRMGDVYANAYLTIAASSSSDDSAGCFPTFTARTQRQHASPDSTSLGRPCLANSAPMIGLTMVNNRYESTYLAIQRWAYVDCDTGGGERSRIYVSEEWMPSSTKRHPKYYSIGRFGALFDPLASEALNQRGWCLQERLLSPRTIHYATEEMIWECQECLLPEDGSRFRRVFPSLKTMLGSKDEKWQEDISEYDFLTHSHRLTPESTLFGRWGDAWMFVVERYTARKLTKEHDKLPALSGLAKSIAELTGEQYCAGLWRSHIIMGLCWDVDCYEPHHWCNDPEHDAKSPAPWKSPVESPKEYRAPSWSWASLNATIKYRSPLKLDEICAECVNVQVTPAGKDSFGRVRSGWITLRAPVFQLRLGWTNDPEGKVGFYSTRVEIEAFGRLSQGIARFDFEPELPCAALFLDPRNAIMVKPLERESMYKRIGTASFAISMEAQLSANPNANSVIATIV